MALTRRQLMWSTLAAALPPAAESSVIIVFLNGGPSQIDTFDPKPGTKNGGPFKAIKTRTPGVLFSEHLPRLAEQSDKLAVIRSLSSREGNHVRARYLMHTGYAPNATVAHPSLGSWIAHERPSPSSQLPPFVSIGGPGAGAGFLGVQYDAFVVKNPDKPPPNTVLPKGVDGAALQARMKLRGAMDDRFFAMTGAPIIKERSAVIKHAEDLLLSPDLGAFTLDTPASHPFVKACLLAPRLIARGVRCVEITLDKWDTHENNFERVAELSKVLDEGMALLLALPNTLVVCMGDFGRTPVINSRDGRDHYPQVSSVLLAGHGIKGGTVHGGTDAEGLTAITPVSVPDLFATAVTAIGISPQRALNTPAGRPIAISDYGKPLEALLK